MEKVQSKENACMGNAERMLNEKTRMSFKTLELKDLFLKVFCLAMGEELYGNVYGDVGINRV